MRVMDIAGHTLVNRELPDPVPEPDQLLVEVAAAGINRADLLQVAGHYPPPAGAAPWPGLEVSGRVIGIGQNITQWQVGDEVCALLPGGGYAERVCVDGALVLPRPKGVDLLSAGALPEAAATAWSNLVEVGGLNWPNPPGANQRVLIHGGSGGVGHLAVQLAKASGAWVATTAGGPERSEFCRTLGADLVVDYRADDFRAVIGEHAPGGQVDLILDVVGAAYMHEHLKLLATGGRLVVIGLQKGRHAELDLGLLLARRASIHGTTLRSRPLAERQSLMQQVYQHVWPLVESGKIRLNLSHTFSLPDAAAAHQAMRDSQILGKAVLLP